MFCSWTHKINFIDSVYMGFGSCPNPNVHTFIHKEGKRGLKIHPQIVTQNIPFCISLHKLKIKNIPSRGWKHPSTRTTASCLAKALHMLSTWVKSRFYWTQRKAKLPRPRGCLNPLPQTSFTSESAFLGHHACMHVRHVGRRTCIYLFFCRSSPLPSQ